MTGIFSLTNQGSLFYIDFKKFSRIIGLVKLKKFIFIVSVIFLIRGLYLTRYVNAGKFIFVPGFSIYEIYDDNIFFLEEDRIDDLITVVSPSFVSSYETKKVKVSATYMSGFEFYSKYPELNTTMNQNASLRLNITPTKRITLDVIDNMSYYAAEYGRGYGAWGGGLGYFGYYGRYRRTEYLELPREERIRTYLDMLTYPTDYWSNSADATLHYRVSPSIDTYAGYFNRFYKYYERERRPSPYALENSWEQGGRTGIDYRTSPRNTFNLEYEYRRFSYTREIDTEIHTATMGWRHEVSPTLFWEISAGPLFISWGDGNGDETNWHASAEISKSFKRIDIGLGYTRDVSTYGGMGGTGIYQTWWGDITSRITPHFTASLTGNYSRQKPTAEGEGDYYQKMHYYTVGLDLTYLFTPRLIGFSSYFYTHQYLEITKENLDYHQAMLALSYSFTRWLSGHLQYIYSNFSYPLFYNATEEDISVYDNRVMLGLSLTWPWAKVPIRPPSPPLTQGVGR